MNLAVLWPLYSKRHWFWRAAALLAAVLIILPTRAYPVVEFFLWFAAFVIAPVLMFRLARRVHRWRLALESGEDSRPPLFQFRVRDLVLAMLLACAWAAIAVPLSTELATGFRFDSSIRWQVALTAGISASITLLHVAAWMDGRSSKLKLISFVFVYLPLLFFAAGNVWAFANWHRFEDVFFERFYLTAEMRTGLTYTLCITSSFCLTAWFITWHLSQRPIPNIPRRYLPHPYLPTIWRVVVGIGTVAIAVPTCWVYWFMCFGTGPIRQKLPDPNGYDRLVKVGADLGNLSTQRMGSERDLASLLDDAWTALELPSRVRLDSDNTVYDRDCERLSMVAAVLDGQAFLANRDGRRGDTASYGFDLVQLGHKARWGGAHVHWFVGRSSEQIGLKWLVPHRHLFKDARRRSVISGLAEIDSQRESFHVALDRSSRWSPRWNSAEEEWGWPGRVSLALELLVAERYPAAQLFDELGKPNKVTVRLLLIDLAIHAYRDDRGAFPEKLSDLVPTYLESVPDDPYSNDSFNYQANGDHFVLYSVGHNGFGEGGQFSPMSNGIGLPSRGDFSLDQITE